MESYYLINSVETATSDCVCGICKKRIKKSELIGIRLNLYKDTVCSKCSCENLQAEHDFTEKLLKVFRNADNKRKRGRLNIYTR